MEGYASASLLSGGNSSYANSFSNVQLLRQAAVAQDPIAWRYFPGANDTTPPSSPAPTAPHFFPGIFADCMGAELALARELDALASNQWSIVNFAVAGSGLGENWLPGVAWPASTQPPNLYAQAVTFLQDYLALGHTLRAFVWIQGERDAQNSTYANAYAANMATFWDAALAVFGQVPLILVHLHSGATGTHTATVRTQQTLFRNTYPFTTLIDCSDLTLTDGLHYSADSYITIGQRVSAAYVAARTTTTLAATIADSDDPLVADGRAFTYAVNVTNGGATAAVEATIRVTLPAGVGFSSGSGTGWTVSHSSGVVTISRASTATGAAPTVTLNCTAPTSVGGGSMTATMTCLASNVIAIDSDNCVTTLSAPAVTADNTSGIYIPQNATEWSNFITAEGLTGLVSVPDLLLLFDEASGNLTDAIGGLVFTASGTNATYTQSTAGWTKQVIRTINAATAAWVCSDAALPNTNTTSLAGLLYGRLNSAPTATRQVLTMGTSNPAGFQITTTPRLTVFDGANTATSSNTPAGAIRPYGWQHNKTGGSTFFCTDEEKFTPAISASVTGKRISIGASFGSNCPPFDFMYMPVWFGSKAEMAASTWAALLDGLGFTRTWSP